MQFFTAKTKRNLFKILPFGGIWLVTGWVFLFTEQAMIVDLDAAYNLDSNIILTPKIVVFASISVFVIGCFVGLLEVLFINKIFTKKSFPQKIFGKLIFYALLMFLVLFIFYQIAASIEMNTSVFDKSVYNRYVAFLFSITYLSNMVQMMFSLFLSLLYAEISENLGQNVLLNFFAGKYHQPRLEERIFMFTDMKDSTAIAEQLGSLRYFEFLKAYYNDLSDAIIASYGEVYQYIGDEIVISWKLNQNTVYDNTLTCFYTMQEQLAKKQNWYLENFGIYPEFKAGIHAGNVTVGEIGALKKEIFFTGDVLNTTARIQALCTQFNTNCLVSKEVVDQLTAVKKYAFNALPNVSLKGKQDAIALYNVSKIEPKC